MTLAAVLGAGAAAWQSRDDASAAPLRSAFRLLVLDGKAVRWPLTGARETPRVTYAFLDRDAAYAGARNCKRMRPAEAALAPSGIDTADFRREVRAAFRMWSEVANIDFRQIDDPTTAGIVIGADGNARGRAFTNVAPHGAAGRNVSGIEQSLICLNPERPWKIGFDGNLDVYDLRYTIAHEIGHAIGLDHPSPAGELMSFRYSEDSRALRDGDIAGAVALYGRREAYATTMQSDLPDLAPHLKTSRPTGAPQGQRKFGIGEAAGAPATASGKAR